MTKLVTISFWCPKAKRSVKMSCQIFPFRDVSIQVAEPQVCWKLRREGCQFAPKEIGHLSYPQHRGCLLGKEIQGNFSEAIEV